jgi:signal transduction histidine kinase
VTDQKLDDLDLVAVVSHEMRTPLAAVQGFVDMLRRRRDGLEDAQIEEFLRIIAEQTDRLSHMVDDLLAMSSLEHGTMPVVPERFLLVPFLENLITGMGAAGTLVHLRIGTDTPARVQTDPMRLRQILTNLIQNAIAYGNGTPVTVTASGGAERLVIEVADRGPGIAPEEAERVFEPFYRGSGRVSGDGAGLGLAITKRLAEALGGTVTVDPRPGEGARFRVSLPRWAG